MVFGIILGIVFGIATLVLGGIAVYNFVEDEPKTGGIFIGAAVVCLIIFICIPFSFHTVDTGTVAVVKHLGEAKDVKKPGTYYDFWMTNTYTTYDTKVQNVDIETSAYSSDAQTMNIQMTLQYSIQSDHIIDIMSQYGSLDVLQNRIQSISIEKAKSVLSSYKAMDIIANRSTMSPAVETAIKEAIGEGYYVNVATVVLTNIDFSDAFELAVEEKMIAEQAKLKAEYENETKVAQAKAEADAKVAAAEAEQAIKEAEKAAELKAAEADKEIIEAKKAAELAEAMANSEIARIQTINIARTLGYVIVTDADTGKEYIDFEASRAVGLTEEKLYDYMKYIAYMESWDGKLPNTILGDDANVIIPTP